MGTIGLRVYRLDCKSEGLNQTNSDLYYFLSEQEQSGPFRKNYDCGELDSLYWVWKNAKENAVGFFPKSEFLEIDDEKADSFALTKKGQGIGLRKADVADAYCTEEYGDKLHEFIEENDVLACREIDVRELGDFESARAWILSDIYHFDNDVISSLCITVQHKYPDVYPYLNNYLSGRSVMPSTMFISKRTVFDEICSFVFSVLSILEKRVKLENKGYDRRNFFQYLVPHLLGAYLMYMERDKKRGLKTARLYGVYTKSSKVAMGIRPAFKENNIAVVFSSSDEFSPYLAVALKSLVNNSSIDKNYDIIILEKSIRETNKKRILDICDGYKNISIRFINTKSIVSGIHFYVPTSDLSEETYYTILVPWVLSNYEKALVLDCDIIINHDVAELFNKDISEYYIAAVKEIIYLGFLNNPILNANNYVMDYTMIKLGMNQPYDYFNAGVLLINLKAFREKFTMQGLLKAIDENHYSIVEQDLLNSVCAEHVYFLEYNWNFMACLTDPDIIDEKLSPSDTTIPNLRLAPYEEQVKYKKASEQPYIYHYLTKMKPWKYPYLEYADIWWRVARTTVYYETFIYRLASNRSAAFENQMSKVDVNLQRIETKLGINDERTIARKAADKLMPKGSKRRNWMKRILPKGSKRWQFCKKVYFLIFPKYNPNHTKKQNGEIK